GSHESLRLVAEGKGRSKYHAGRVFVFARVQEISGGNSVVVSPGDVATGLRCALWVEAQARESARPGISDGPRVRVLLAGAIITTVIAKDSDGEAAAIGGLGGSSHGIRIKVM